jgi:hypothetical protein
MEKEDNYSGKVEDFNNEKFEILKREAIVSVNTINAFTKPGVYFEAE